MNKSHLSYSIVIPVFNSEATIAPLVQELLRSNQHDLEIILVDDYSKDGSADIIWNLSKLHPGVVRAFHLSKNFGEHQAVLAGLAQAQKDFAVIIDDDFQNPPSEIFKLIEYAVNERKEVVYGVYTQKKHSKFRNLGSQFNGWVADYLIDKPRGLYLSSFKCMSNFVYQEIVKYKGPYPYIDGLIFRVTNNVGSVIVAHSERNQGQSNYTIKKLVRLWMNMVFNFSNIPLRLITYLGCSFSLLGMLLAAAFVLEKFLNPELVMGWASVIVAILLFSGIQLIILGLMGEYMGRLFFTANQTPQYIIRRGSN